MGVCGYALVCKGVYEYVLVFAGVCDMNGCVHVCGMNFQNFFWRIYLVPTSADFNTYPTIRIFS